jgi:membrane protein YdbS with pleckstrin-like domain
LQFLLKKHTLLQISYHFLHIFALPILTSALFRVLFVHQNPINRSKTHIPLEIRASKNPNFPQNQTGRKNPLLKTNADFRYLYSMKVLTSDTKQCPFCGEMIRAQAIKCRFCAEFLNTDQAKALEANSQPNGDSAQADKILFAARPSLWAMTSALIKGLLVSALAGFLLKLPIENMVSSLLKLELTDSQANVIAEYRVIGGIGLIIFVSLILLLKMLRLKMTRYVVSPDRVEWSRGILDRKVDNLDMFRVIDLKMRRSLLDCVVGVGTVGLITTDKTDPQFTFEKIHHSRRLYDIIKKASLAADKRSSVIHLE